MKREEENTYQVIFHCMFHFGAFEERLVSFRPKYGEIFTQGERLEIAIPRRFLALR